MKKKIFLLIFCFCLGLSAIFWRQILLFSFDTVLAQIVQKKLSAKIVWEKISFKNGKFILQDIDILRTCSRKNFGFYLKAKEVVVKPRMGDLSLEVYLKSPELSLVKEKDVPLSFGQNEEGFFKISVTIDEGSFELIDKTEIKKETLKGNIQSIHSSPAEYRITFQDSSSMQIGLQRDEDSKILNLDAKDIDLKDLYQAFLFFSPSSKKHIHALSGKIHGFSQIGWDASGINRFFLQEIVKDLHLSAGAYEFEGTGKISLEYPKSEKTKENSLRSFFLNKPFSEMACRLHLDAGKILLHEEALLSSLEGTFSYNPGTGPKCQFGGIAANLNSFQISGRGFFQSKHANWLDLDIHFLDDRTSLFLLEAREEEQNIKLSFDAREIGPEKIAFFQNLLAPIYPELLEVQMEKGTISTKCDFIFSEDHLKEIALNSCTAKETAIAIPSRLFAFRVPAFSASGFFDLEEEKTFSSLSTQLEIVQGECFFGPFEEKTWKMHGINSCFSIEKGNISPSHIDLFFNGIKNHIELSGPIDELSARSNFQGKMKNLFELCSQDFDSLDQEVSGMIAYKREKEKAGIIGNVQIEEDEITCDAIAFGLHLKTYDVIEALLRRQPQDQISHGWVRGDGICLGRYAPLFETLDIILAGEGDFAAQYQENLLTLFLKGRDLSIETPYGHLFLKELGSSQQNIFHEDSLRVSYDLLEKEWGLTGKMENAKIYLPAFDLTLDKMKSDLTMRKNFLEIDVIDCLSEELHLSGKTYFDFRDGCKLDILTEGLSGSIDAWKNFSAHFGLASEIDVQGEIKSEEGFYLSTTFDGDTVWGFEADLQNASLELSNFCSISGFKAHMIFHSEEEHLKLLGGEGAFHLDSREYTLRLPQFEMQMGIGCVFDVRLEKPLWDILRLYGECSFEEDKNVFSFDPYFSEFYGTKLHIDEFVLKDFSHLLSLKMKPSFSLSTFFPKLQFLLDLGFSPLNNLDLSALKSSDMEGDLTLSLSLSEEASSLDITGANLSFQGESFQEAHFHAEKEEKDWRIDRFSVDGFSSSFFLNVEDHWTLSDVLLRYGDSCFAEMEVFYPGEGKFTANVNKIQVDIEELSKFSLLKKLEEFHGDLQGKGFLTIQFPSKGKPWNIEADLDLDPGCVHFQEIGLENRSPMHFFYSSEEGLMVRGLDLAVQNESQGISFGNFCIDTLSFIEDTQNWHLKKTHFYLPENFMSTLDKILEKETKHSFSFDRDVEIDADIGFSWEQNAAWIAIENVNLPINGDLWPIRDLLFSYSQKGYEWECDFGYKGKFFQTKGNIDLAETLKGALIFREEDTFDPPLTLLWEWEEEEGILLKNIQGSFSGLDASFHESDQKKFLTGSMKVDFKKLSQIVPSNVALQFQEFELGDGYEIRGNLFLDPKKRDYHFDGILSGKYFELMGFEFKTLLAKLDATPDHFYLKDFKISDSAGILKIEEVLCEEKEDIWMLSIPHVRVTELRPSLMKEIGKELGELEPLVVRNLEIHDFGGRLKDSETFTGKGHLNFINSFKREHTVFDIPADFLGRIFGLDLELLIPVKGDIDFEIEEGYVYLTDLTDSYSENQRSKFFLVEKDDDPPCMDFDANLSIHIKMKQYVLFKFTEHFIISIKGTLRHPLFNLKRKKSFFSS